MQTAEKIANLLLSDEEANKDLAFALMEGQGVDFEEVLGIVKGILLQEYQKVQIGKEYGLTLLPYRIRFHRSVGGQLSTYIYRRSKSINGRINFWELVDAINILETIEAIEFFLTRVKLAYHEIKQSNHHSQ